MINRKGTCSANFPAVQLRQYAEPANVAPNLTRMTYFIGCSLHQSIKA